MIDGGGQARRRGRVYIFGADPAARHGQRCSLSLIPSKTRFDIRHSFFFLRAFLVASKNVLAADMVGTGDISFFFRGERAELVGEQAASDVPERKNEKGVDKERNVCYNRIRGLGMGLHRAKSMTPRRTKNYVIIYYVGVNGK